MWSNEIQETEAQKAGGLTWPWDSGSHKTTCSSMMTSSLDKVDDLNNESEVRQAGWQWPRWVPLNPLAEARAGLAADGGRRRGSDQRQVPGCHVHLETDQALSQTDTTNRAPVQPAR